METMSKHTVSLITVAAHYFHVATMSRSPASIPCATKSCFETEMLSSLALKLVHGRPPMTTFDKIRPPGQRSLKRIPPSGTRRLLFVHGKVRRARMVEFVSIADASCIDTRPYAVAVSFTCTRSPSDSHTRGRARPNHNTPVCGCSHTNAHFKNSGTVSCDGVQ